MTIKISKEDWKWCMLCETAYRVCPKCENSSCNGGGCDFCMTDPYHVEARRMLQAGEEPKLCDFPDEQIYPYFLIKPESEWTEHEVLMNSIFGENPYMKDFCQTAWSYACNKVCERHDDSESFFSYYRSRMDKNASFMTADEKEKCKKDLMENYARKGSERETILQTLVERFLC